MPPPQDWGYEQLGRPFPEGISLPALAETLDDRHFQIDLRKAFGGLLAPLALVAAGCAWQAYMHAVCPMWQQVVCWLAVGTGYFGLFQAAVDCAHFAFWPQVRCGVRKSVCVCVRACFLADAPPLGPPCQGRRRPDTQVFLVLSPAL